MSINARAIATLGVGFGALAMASLGYVAQIEPATQPIPAVHAGAAERATAPARPGYKQVRGDITSRGATDAEVVSIRESVRPLSTQGATRAGAAAVSEAVRDIASAGSSRASIEIGIEHVPVFSDTELMALAAWYSRS